MRGPSEETVAAAWPAATRARTATLWIEFLALFVAAPLIVTFHLGPRGAFSTLFALAALGAYLLHVTPGFSWRRLLFELPARRALLLTLGFAIGAGAILSATALALVPGRFLALPLHRPELWITIMIAYPLISVVPQELLFRSLFFERYGALFGDPRLAIAVNALAFGLAHLFYWNWPALILTTFGGLAFAFAYRMRGGFLLACLWHALAGQILFTVGLGLFFYHGAAPQ